MSTGPSPINQSDSPTRAVEINRICDRFEAQFRAGGRPTIESEIADADEPIRSQLLRELLAVELECRRSAGEAPRLPEYRGRFPGDAEIIEAAFARRDGPIPTPALHDDPTVTQVRRPLDSISTGPATGSDQVAIGRYTVMQRLGQGGFGLVYLARDAELDRLVAIKVPKPDRISRPKEVDAYLAEARILARLDHPHIVPVYDLGRTDDGLCFVVSKYIEGSNLAAMMVNSAVLELTRLQDRPNLRWFVNLQRQTSR